MKEYIEVGKITSTHALKGELKMIYWCDDVDFLTDVDLFFLDDNGKEQLEVEQSRVHKNFLIIKFANIDDVSKAEKYIDKILYIPRKWVKLQKGEYLQCDLIGLTVVDVDSGKIYGEIFKITRTGANDVYHIKDKDNDELLIPAIRDVIKIIDDERNIMYIKPLNGLFDL